MRPDITYAEAVREALDFCLSQDKNVFVVGEGVPDPKKIFNTTAGLLEKYGPQRIMDMPLSENALTGVCIGSGLIGMRPVMVHQRTDFAYLALDQIINNAAKWHYMFNGQGQVPIVIRMMIGRGWGQGPQHSSSPQALFSHIPGLKVVMPARPHDAKGMLIQAIEDNGPVIFLEHRWLHHMKEPVPEEPFREPLGKARVVRSGDSLTLAAFSYSVIEATKIPPEWHSWIHFTTQNPPSEKVNKFSWQKEHEENLTGTNKAHKPDGSLFSESKKNMKKYETWKF